ncbi:hypothetical protein KP509_14G058500 [Ceratopteris richardii]|uniref:Uncharacterized protein n=1 Tax=Ceratopteris richardii TaxID=49495 RepID=A0A8T2T8B2_CERRI|nr:hypothetical protein KP509_14G058500 [Ceratopteris richardii]
MYTSAVDGGAVLRKVIQRRWIRCYIFQTMLSVPLWIFFGSSITSLCFWSKHNRLQLSLSQRFFRFLCFYLSQTVFLLGVAMVTHPEEKDAATTADIFFGILKLTWRAIVGASTGKNSPPDSAVLVQKIQTSRDQTLFFFLGAISGSLSLVSMTWTASKHLSVREEACQGAALGILFSLWFLQRKRMVLRFPIIQRSAFFTFKLGLKEIVGTSIKLAVLSVPLAELLILVLNSSSFAAFNSKKSKMSYVGRELDFVIVAAFTATLWGLTHQLVQAVHTRRYHFAPPVGTAAAETNPSDLLLQALEAEKSSLVHYLAALDLCMLSEHNSDAWRLSALFEESGETYNRVVSTCLKPLNMLTIKLAKGLDGLEEAHEKASFKQQMQLPGKDSIPSTYEVLNDDQLCCWCVRILSSLTSSSKNHDRYGVAQLRGCNGAVVSSLLSCLLVIEVYLGRRSSTQPGQTVGLHGIKWTIPSRGLDSAPEKIKGFPFPKKSQLYKKAYAIADVLRTSLYQIVTTFRKEMDGSGPGGMVVAERDWLDKGQPLYGTRELHIQCLRMLLDFKM